VLIFVVPVVSLVALVSGMIFFFRIKRESGISGAEKSSSIYFNRALLLALILGIILSVLYAFIKPAAISLYSIAAFFTGLFLCGVLTQINITGTVLIQKEGDGLFKKAWNISVVNSVFAAATALLFCCTIIILLGSEANASLLAFLLGIGIFSSVLNFSDGIDATPANIFLLYTAVLATALMFGSPVGKLLILLLASISIIVSGIFVLFFKIKEDAFYSSLIKSLLAVSVIAFILFFVVSNYLLGVEARLLLPVVVGLITSLLLVFLVYSTKFSKKSDDLISCFGEGGIFACLIIVVVGGAILLSNRLYGSYGIALFALGIFTPLFLLLPLNYLKPLLKKKQGLEGTAMIAYVLYVSAAIAIARALLQSYLRVTYLGYLGVTVTNAYSFVGLILGALFPFLFLAALAYSIKKERLSLLVGTVALLAPIFIGFLIHIEPLASYLIGFLVVAFILAVFTLTIKAANVFQEEDSPASMLAIKFSLALPGLLITSILLSIISAPWLIAVINATRPVRVIVFVITVVVIVIGFLASSKKEKQV